MPWQALTPEMVETVTRAINPSPWGRFVSWWNASWTNKALVVGGVVAAGLVVRGVVRRSYRPNRTLTTRRAKLTKTKKHRPPKSAPRSVSWFYDPLATKTVREVSRPVLREGVSAHDLGRLAELELLGYRPNRGRRRSGKFAVPTTARAGRIMTWRGHKFGHLTAPKKYRKIGATQPKHYGWPHGFMYPLVDAKHVRLAASRLGKHGRRYPPVVRAVIARRIDAAKRHFGIGPYHSRR